MAKRFSGLLAALVLLAGPSAWAAPSLPDAPPEAEGIPVLLLTDSGSGRQLLARQPDLRFVPASMTKVKTAYVAFGLMAQGKLSPRTMVTVPDDLAREWNGKGTSLYLRPGEEIAVDMLLRGITTVSANDASVALAVIQAGTVEGWTAQMNAEARRLGMTNSHFATPNGWPDNGATYVSARDMVTLGQAMVRRYPDFYRSYIGKPSLTRDGVALRNHDPVIGVVQGADGIKTGHTNEAGYNFLGSAERDGRRLFVVIGGAQTADQRAKAARALLEWGFAAWQARPLFKAGALVGEARVQGGDVRHVGLVAPHEIHATMPKDSAANLTLRIRYNGPLVAPFDKGAELAELEILEDGLSVGTVPLRSAEAVGKAGALDRLWNAIMGLFA